MQIRVVNQVSTSPPRWECQDPAWHLLQDAEVPQLPLQHPAAGSGCGRDFWTLKCLEGNEKQYFCGVEASLNNVVVCNALPSPAGREQINVHIDRNTKKCRLYVVHWGPYQ